MAHGMSRDEALEANQSSLEPEDLKALLEHATCACFGPDEVIATRESAGTDRFLLLCGHARLVAETAVRRQVVYGEAGVGSILRAEDLVSNRHPDDVRVFRAEADGAVVCRVRQEDFDWVFEASMEFKKHVVMDAGRWVSSAHDHIVLALAEREREDAALIEHLQAMEGAQLVLHTTGELAEMLGVAVAEVDEAMNLYRRLGIIGENPHEPGAFVFDPKRLAALVREEGEARRRGDYLFDDREP